MNVEETYTIEQFIQFGENDKIGYKAFSLFAHDSDKDITIVAYNIINDYLDELKDLAQTVLLDDETFMKYIYKPKLLAYDIYGSGELFFIILAINNMCSVKEFRNKKIKMLSQQTMQDVITAIYNSERSTIDKNRNEIEI